MSKFVLFIAMEFFLFFEVGVVYEVNEVGNGERKYVIVGGIVERVLYWLLGY